MAILSNKIETVASIDLFFRDCINQAALQHKQQLSQAIEHYLVSLLSEYAHFGDNSSTKDNFDKPLVFMISEALELPDRNKIPIYKQIGDKTLYLSGFFSSYFSNKLFSVDYYMQIGTGAYSQLEILFERLGDFDFKTLYHQLANSFHVLVHILESVRHSLKGLQEKDSLIHVYERWLISGSPASQQKLQELGFVDFSEIPKAS